MRGMESYSRAAMERAMKVQEVILRAVAKKITWWQAAEIIGISDRHMRRWRERYEGDLLRATGGGRSDPHGDGGAAGSDRAERPILRAVQRSWQPFLADAEGGRSGRSASPHAGRSSAARTGYSHDSGLFAAGARAQRTQLRHLAGTFTPGAATGRMHDARAGESIPPRTLHRRVQPPLSSACGAAGHCLCALHRPRSGACLFVAV